MTITSWLQLYVILILFSPALTVGIRTIYLAELYVLILPFLLLFTDRGVVVKEIRAIVLALSTVFALLFVQASSYGVLLALDLVRFLLPYFVLFGLLHSRYVNSHVLLKTIVRSSLLVALIGCVQVLDHQVFNNAFSVNNVLSTLYPYTGELSEAGASKSGGLSLKMSSVGTATSTFDGHPILFGDFLAFAASLCLLQKNKLGFLIVLFACTFTYSRGAWAGLFLGFIAHAFLFERQSLSRFMLRFSSLVGVFFALILSVSELRDYLFFRIMNTLAVFGFADYGFGNKVDPRTSYVWPRVINFFFDDSSRWLAGAPFSHPTDSGYLNAIQQSGVVGLLLVVSVFMYLFFNFVQQKREVLLLMLVLFLMMIVHPVFQGYRTVHYLALLIFVYSFPKSGWDHK